MDRATAPPERPAAPPVLPARASAPAFSPDHRMPLTVRTTQVRYVRARSGFSPKSSIMVLNIGAFGAMNFQLQLVTFMANKQLIDGNRANRAALRYHGGHIHCSFFDTSAPECIRGIIFRYPRRSPARSQAAFSAESHRTLLHGYDHRRQEVSVRCPDGQ